MNQTGSYLRIVRPCAGFLSDCSALLLRSRTALSLTVLVAIHHLVTAMTESSGLALHEQHIASIHSQAALSMVVLHP